MAPPRNLKHLKLAQQKNASARLKTLRNVYGAIQSHHHITYCTSPINITQNIYPSPTPPTPFFQQFYKHIPPPALNINNPPPTPFNANNRPPTSLNANPTPTNNKRSPTSLNTNPTPTANNPIPPHHSVNTKNPSTSHSVLPKFRDYSKWQNNKTKAVGITPKRRSTSKLNIGLGRSPMTTDNISEENAKITLPFNISSKVTNTTVSPKPL